MPLSWTTNFMELEDHGQVIVSALEARWVGCAYLRPEQLTWYWLRPNSFGSMSLWSFGGLGGGGCP